MLKCALIVIDKLIVVIGIDKIVIVFGKYKRRTDMQLWQLRIMWIFDNKHFFSVVIEVFALFVTQVCICVTVAYNFARSFNANGSVIGGNNHSDISLS